MLDKYEALLTKEQIEERIREMGRQITQDYQGKSIHCLCILKGAFIFMADLVRHVDAPITCDFLTISSYGDLTHSTGVVKLLTDLTVPIDGRHVLVVEDIVETGLTLKYLLENLHTRQPASVRVCSLLHKPEGKQVEVPIDYCGFVIPNKFVIGYGLDDKQYERNLPYIGVVDTPDEDAENSGA